MIHGGVAFDSPWLNDQHLAHGLARAGAEVLYVDPPESLARARRPTLRTAAAGVRVLRPVALPKLGAPWSQRLSAPLVRAQLRRALRGETARAAVAFSPPGRCRRGAAGERRFVAFTSDWLPAGAGLLGVGADVLERECAALWAVADVVCVTSAALQDELAGRGVAAHVLAHGFDDAVAGRYDAPAPADYDGLPRPLLAVAGRLNARLDLDLLGALADHRPDATLVLIGPIAARDRTPALEALLGRPKVVHVLSRSREELPPYLAHADALLIPYVADTWNRYSSPMKVWDYLYAGPPIVAHGLPGVAREQPDIPDAAGPEQFVALVDAALAADDPAGRARRRAAALAGTWTVRVAQLRELVAA